MTSIVIVILLLGIVLFVSARNTTPEKARLRRLLAVVAMVAALIAALADLYAG